MSRANQIEWGVIDLKLLKFAEIELQSDRPPLYKMWIIDNVSNPEVTSEYRPYFRLFIRCFSARCLIDCVCSSLKSHENFIFLNAINHR